MGEATYYSDGLYAAVACTDYPQLFDMTATRAVRRQQLIAVEKSLPSNTFAPFTATEWTQMNTYTEDFTGCLDWPAPTHHDPPITKTPPLVDSHVPVPVLNGSLDSLTPTAGGAHLGAQLGPEARSVEVPNMVHPRRAGRPVRPRIVVGPDVRGPPGATGHARHLVHGDGA